MAAVAAPAAFASAPALQRNVGKFRSLNLINNRTGEWLNSVYWIEGAYVPEALQAFNFILRDWREDQSTEMDPGVLDILWGTHQLLECTEPFQVISGYRTPETNAMLRRRNRRVARNSYHMRGMAVDITLQTRSVRSIAKAAASLEGGGVGRYSRRHFVHIDSGPVRYWGR